MPAPLLTIIAIFALGLLFVLLPVAVGTYRRFHYRKVVNCPENHQLAEVTLKAGRAAWMSIFGRTSLRAKWCTRWPARKGCAERCVKENWSSP